MFRSEQEVRKAIIELIAFRTPWAHKLMIHGEDKFPDLAERLGVTSGILRESLAKYRLGFVPEVDRQQIRVNAVFHLPKALYTSLKASAKASRMKVTGFLRSLLHTLMLTTREPVNVLVRSADRHAGGLGARANEPRGGVGRSHLSVILSAGLNEALTRRAAARGMSLNAYVVCWLADLHEMRLKDLDFTPIETHQMFDSVHAYVIPVEANSDVTHIT